MVVEYHYLIFFLFKFHRHWNLELPWRWAAWVIYVSNTDTADWYITPGAESKEETLKYVSHRNMFFRKKSPSQKPPVCSARITGWQMSKQKANSWTSIMRSLFDGVRMEKRACTCVCHCVCECVGAMTEAVKSFLKSLNLSKLAYGMTPLQLHPSPLCSMHSCYLCGRVCVCACVGVCVCACVGVCLDNSNTSFFSPNRQGASAIVVWLGYPFKLSGISNCEALCSKLPQRCPLHSAPPHDYCKT